MPSQVRIFHGKKYSLAVTRIPKATAEKEAKKLRDKGLLTRIVREARGKHNVYARTNFGVR